VGFLNRDDDRYRGVRGWLLLLCFTLTVLDPLAALFNITYTTHLAKPHFHKVAGLSRLVVVSGAASIALSIFSLYAGISLWKKMPRAVSTAKKYLITVLAYSLFSLVLPTLVGLSSEYQDKILEGSFLTNLRTGAYVLAWYLYLERSKRVQSTYRDGEAGAGSE
jgi:hypothetical protein